MAITKRFKVTFDVTSVIDSESEKKLMRFSPAIVRATK